jgi:AcrR family transcriptional regulator
MMMPNQPAMHTNSRRRPGGRTAEVTARVHKAILELIVEGGFEACTFSAVAERAGVERSTLYRRFPDRWDAVIDAWVTVASTEVVPDLGDSFASDLRSVLRRLAGTLETPLGPALLGIVATLRARDGPDFPREFFDRRMEALAPMFEAAIDRGELPADVDREEIFTLAAGPIYFRMFIAARQVDEKFIDSIVAQICTVHCTPNAAAKLSLSPRLP